MDLIAGKNILLICYPFFGYDEAIRDELYRLGAKTVFLKKAQYFPSSPRDEMFLDPWYKAPIYFLKDPNGRTNWTEQLKREIDGIRFDVLLVIENTCFKKSFITYLKSINPAIKTIWFLWDTFETQQKWHRDYIPLFDKVYTFDRDDAKKYNLEYYPDFYVKPAGESQNKYDVCFVGSGNQTSTAYRIEFLSKIKKQCDSYGLRQFFYLKYSQPSTYHPIKKLIKKYRDNLYAKMVSNHIDEGFMHLKPLPLDDCNCAMRDSNVILDMNHMNRQGMTINAVFAIASGKKLITTNKRINEEPFFHPNNILIVDEENPTITADFLYAPIVPIDMSDLRLDNWLKHIINS